MLIIGLTGGIGSGKSTAARYFSELGVPVIDADVIARELVQPGEPALKEITRVFGRGVLQEDGTLDRARLRERAFADTDQRRALEAILHPRVRAEMQRRLTALQAPYCILVIPLLLEAHEEDLVDRILVIDAPEALQYQRVKARSGLGDGDIEAIMHAQTDRETRREAADDLLLNDGTEETLRAAVERLHRTYLRLADAAKIDHPDTPSGTIGSSR